MVMVMAFRTKLVAEKGKEVLRVEITCHLSIWLGVAVAAL